MDQNDKLSIKNLLFFRAIPSYKIPLPTDGHKLFTCTDCSDRFVLESSYEHHINRKSVTITYNCRSCNDKKIFYNRCNLLSHIRSHTFKTATINVSDLTIEPLPLSFFNFDVFNKQKHSLPTLSTEKLNTSDGANKQKRSLQSKNWGKITPPDDFNKQTLSLQSKSSEKLISSDGINKQKRSLQSTSSEKPAKWLCFDCKVEFTTCKPIYKDRAKHYMQVISKVHTCPVCLFALPTTCALKAHLRLHTNSPPFYCPECGQHLTTKSISYPFNHHCEGFNMMRATTRLECKVPNCNFFHPNDIKEHFKKHHFNKVFKCQTCVVACFNEQTMYKHIQTQHSGSKSLVFFQCVLCPGRLVLQDQIDNHLKAHDFEIIYPCWECGITIKNVNSFIKHHIDKHCKTEETRKIYLSSVNVNEPAGTNRTYRVIKRCEQCKRSFTYKCKYDEIQILPNECPYKCTLEPQQNIDSTNLSSTDTQQKEIICPLCKKRISENWEVVKKHYANNHEKYRCVDITIVLEKIGTKLSKPRNNVTQKKKRSRKLKKKKCITKRNNTSNKFSTVLSRNETVLTTPSKSEAVPTTPSKSEAVPTTPCKSEAVPTTPCKSEAVPTTPSKTEAMATTPPKSKVMPTTPSESEVVPTTPSKSEVVATTPPKTEQCKCSLCDYRCDDKESLEIHILNHRDPCMAYQCMECGKSYVVKPSFTTHLLVDHSIANVDEYIQQKQCYNQNAMEKNINIESHTDEPLQENQCRICREQFSNNEDLEKHFRMHGMAFLLQSTTNKIS